MKGRFVGILLTLGVWGCAQEHSSEQIPGPEDQIARVEKAISRAEVSGAYTRAIAGKELLLRLGVAAGADLDSLKARRAAEACLELAEHYLEMGALSSARAQLRTLDVARLDQRQAARMESLQGRLEAAD